MLSQKFIERLKLSETPQYKLAIRAGINPCVLSKIVIGAQTPRFGDERLIRIGKLLGLKPDEIYETKEKRHKTR